jgi:simple sugar transport system permease protein
VLATFVKMLYTTAAENEVASGVIRYRISILWFLLFAVVGTWLLVRTRFGNWIFAVGGNREAARVEGVPAARTKTTLFMIVSGAAWLSGMLIAFRLNSVQADVGDGEEFEYIIAAVVGGNLLTGGYGSAAGGAIGSLIMSMSTQGIPFAGWSTNWRALFLGVILLLAVAGNNYIRRRAELSR